MPLKVTAVAKKDGAQLPEREAETIHAILETRYDLLVAGVTVIEDIRSVHIMTTSMARDFAREVQAWARARFSDLDIEVRFDGEVE